MAKEIGQFLYERGYKKIESQIPLFMKEAEDVVYLVQITGMTYDQFSPPEVYLRRNQQLIFEYNGRTRKDVQVLNLIFVPSIQCKGIAEVAEKVPNVWVIEQQNNRLLLFENQSKQFDNLYDDLESWLIVPKEENEVGKIKSCPITLILIAINVIVYLILSNMGDVYDPIFMFAHGAQEWRSVFYEHEYYRLFTSMFLHFGWEHLFNNMLVLLIAGIEIEMQIGKIRYFLLYFISGLFGNLVSAIAGAMTGSIAISAGASGAIYGVVGATIISVILDREKRERFSLLYGAILLVGSFYMATQDGTIDYFAHGGGVIMGMALGILFHMIPKKKLAHA
ncbi:MAG TPA: hypothetical protein DIT54_08620 [Lachnospiraceae bacterium]|jgi:rhomboid protease GluP|nr:hypothetical protein [Lachnospiraceae bacterium]HIS61888.1 rhomboid family intramembrane serine protease [Candidatus Scybalomonas excrementigallinarum]